MSIFDFLEDIGGKNTGFVRMMTDFKVIMIFVVIALLVFIFLILYPIIIWIMRILH